MCDSVFCCLHVGPRGVGWEGAAQSAPELPEGASGWQGNMTPRPRRLGLAYCTILQLQSLPAIVH